MVGSDEALARVCLLGRDAAAAAAVAAAAAARSRAGRASLLFATRRAFLRRGGGAMRERVGASPWARRGALLGPRR